MRLKALNFREVSGQKLGGGGPAMRWPVISVKSEAVSLLLIILVADMSAASN